MRSFIASLALCAAVGAALVAGQPAERAFAAESCIEAVPGPVTDLSAGAAGDKSIAFSWNAPNGDNCVDSYSYFVVEKGQPDPRTFPPAARDYSVTVHDLKPNTEYIVKVAAVNSQKGTGPMSSVVVKTDRRCLGILPPGLIGKVHVNQISNSRLSLSWLPPILGGCTDSYEIVGEDVRAGKRVIVASSTSPQTKVVGLYPGANLVFRITPHNRNLRGLPRVVTYTMKQYGPRTAASGSVPAGH